MRLHRLLIICALATGAAMPVVAQRPLPAPYASGSQVNSIRTWEVKAPITTPSAVTSAGLREVKMTTVYFDGLGREIQNVVKKGSLPTGDTARDLVSGKVYDTEGRAAIDYLPFSAGNAGSNSSISDGEFKRNPFVQQTAYFNARLAGQTGETNVGVNSLTWAYNAITYDGSPMDRIAKTLPAGAAWVGSDRGITTNYWVNTAEDNVRRWVVTDVPGEWGTYSSPGAYTPGSLLKNVETNEEGQQEITFTDKAGRVVLIKRHGDGTADDGAGTDAYTSQFAWRWTYFVYDDLGNLRLIITPKIAAIIRTNWYLGNEEFLSKYCFRYEYNGRKQLIRAQKPGIDEVRYVYDKRGRIALIQDGNLRKESPYKWMYSRYDSLNRVVATGLWTSSTMAAWSTLLSEGSVTDNYPSLSPGTFEELTVKRYNSYQSLPVGFSATMDATNLSASTIVTSYGSSPEYAEPIVQAPSVNGKLAWEGEKILGTSQFLYKVYYYDDKDRMIQQRSSNASGSISSLTRQYNFAGQIIRMVANHQKGGTNPSSVTVCSKTTYDDLGREIYKGQKTNPAEPYKTLSTFAYDHLGKLKTKTYGAHPVSGQPLETQDYEYNVRGWLLGVNQPFALDSTNQSRWFGYQLAYDNDGAAVHGAANAITQKRYDGSIGRVLWKSAGDQKIRKYDLTYDPFNHLTTAYFKQFRGSDFVIDEINFSMTSTYDLIGNLQSLSHLGWKDGSIAVIDALNYSYDGNKLLQVAEGYGYTPTQAGDFSYSPSQVGFKWANDIDYTYDPSGNLTKDKNKDIDTIFYNHLHLPTRVNVRGKGIIYFNYAASGTKLEKIVVDSTKSPVRTTTTKYIDNFVYQSVQHTSAQPQDYTDKMQYFRSPEGRTRHLGDGVYKDDYMIQDHLGNVRMVLSDELGTDTYPTLSFEGASGSTQVINQDTYWENKTGASINVTAARIARPGAFGDTTANGHQVMLVRKSTGAIGAAKLLKVMRGDRLHAFVEYFFTAANANNSPADGLASLLADLGAALAGNPGFSDFLKPGAATFASNLSGNSALASLLNTAASSSGANVAPKAYLNIVFFDEQMKPDLTASRVFPIAYSPNTKAAIDRRLANAIQAQKNGYAYVYFSNESNEMVYFDNFTISHEHSPLLEETHYYPFGLPIAAISSKALGKLPIKFAFNGKEMQSGEFGNNTGLQWHDFGARMYDHQIGRWLSPDPHADRYEWISPYAFSFDNPMQVNDPTGRDGVVTGSGTQTDPYVVTANYYTHNMTDEQVAAFTAALAAYNNGGNAHEVEVDGQTVYVRFDLGHENFATRSEAREAAGNDVVTRGSRQFSFGNTVTVGTVRAGEGEDALGAATNRDIVLDENKMQQMVNQHNGVTMDQLRTGVAIHEIGHNLGGVHNDPGNIMVDTDIVGVRSPGRIGGDPESYRAYVSSVNLGGIRAIAGRFNTPVGSVESRYISARERRKITETSRNGNVIPVTVQEFNDR